MQREIKTNTIEQDVRYDVALTTLKEPVPGLHFRATERTFEIQCVTEHEGIQCINPLTGMGFLGIGGAAVVEAKRRPMGRAESRRAFMAGVLGRERPVAMYKQQQTHDNNCQVCLNYEKAIVLGAW